MKSNVLIHLGAEDWMHAAWRGRFYPDDLPDEWLLSYYNTQFKTVFLSSRKGGAAGTQDWSNWLSDTLEDFVFIVENSDGLQVPSSDRILVASPDWLVRHVYWLDDAPDLRALARRIAEHAATGVSLFVISREGGLDALQRAQTLREVMGY
ncbi:hypothetical protein F8A86_03685 [Betaproteobacteria bacterium SCN1]|jgi:hypothetical protein|nr:hypothetical protein F8A86_03685 [Betaproteobacteria bacterium SCN1]MBN8761258.1 hypothetical protein [Thiobacillus sp.]ODU88444.1 MAG: hypothetical protein ABT21_11040 [Thiobacillus sp. SCN 65-179]OJW36472.1 MAG: hypothetical protein BGO61_02045 [Thiobacillus sp. 65-69]